VSICAPESKRWLLLACFTAPNGWNKGAAAIIRNAAINIEVIRFVLIYGT
jgi:hypothetical protein